MFCFHKNFHVIVTRALTGKYPPKIRMYSKYERRTDTRTYDDRRKLYEGGWDVLYTELLEKSWKEKMDEWTGRAKCMYNHLSSHIPSCKNIHTL